MDFLKNNRLFSFRYGEADFWSLPMTVKQTQAGNTLTTEYLLEDGLKVTNVAKCYPEFGAYEWVNYFENTAAVPTKLISQLWDADVTLPMAHAEPKPWTAFIGDYENETLIYAPAGSTCDIDEFYSPVHHIPVNHFKHHIYPGKPAKPYRNVRGRSCDGQAPFFNIHYRGQGVVCAVGWTGQWNTEFQRDADSVTLRSKIEDTHFQLWAGEKIRTSSFVMMPYENLDFDRSQNKWKRLVKAEFSLVGQPGREEQLPFCAAIWGGMKTEQVLDRVKLIREEKLPFEYIWMDAGWYGNGTQESPDEFEGDWPAHTGNWMINKTYHPDGLQDVKQAVKDAGLKFLLWFEPERVIYSTPIAQEHPEYFLDHPTGDDNLLLDLGNEEAWQYCHDLLADKIRELGIDCYRQDFNFCPLDYWRKHDPANRQGISEIKHITGLYRLWDALLAEFPHLFIDNCASGGLRIDIEMLRRSAPLWRSDLQCPADWIINSTQNHHLNFSTWLPWSGTGSGRTLCDTYRFRTAYAPGMNTGYVYSAKTPTPSTPEELDWIRRYGEEYKKVRPYLSRDFFPLTDRLPADDGWAACQFNRPEFGDGIVQIFRREKSPYCTAQFQLQDLDGEYEFTDADDGSTFTLTGNVLNITVEQPRTAKLYFYKRIQ